MVAAPVRRLFVPSGAGPRQIRPLFEAATEAIMAGSVQFVTRSRRVAQMPQWASEFAELVQHCGDSGLFTEVARRLRFSYKRGFGVLDLTVFFMALACGYNKGGIRGFRAGIQACAVRLAAIAGRHCLPTSASVSRGLCAAERIANLDQEVAWLLGAGAQVQALCRSPLAQARDAHGLGWTVLDFDPSVTALRQRALPEHEDLPEPRRRAASLCAPGYPGRHRGETQVSIAILSHTAAGLFLQATTHAGNTPFADALGIAAQAAASLVDICELPRDHTLIRFDGAGGYAAAIAQAGRQNLHYLTRLKHHSVYAEPGVAEHLASATWQDVTDSRSGPRRQATELGRFVVGHDGAGAAVVSRLVVSRFVCPDGEKHGAGMVQGGFHYEAFATDLDPGAWPAPDTVTLYYGRCGQENQFGQAIRRMRLGEIFCFDLYGQRLATALLMWVSNLRMTRAAAFVGELGGPPEQAYRPGPSDPELAVAPAESASEPPVAPVPPLRADSLVEPTQTPPESPLAPHKACPRGFLAPLHNIRQSNGSGCYAIYRVPAGLCWPCPQRADCTQSTNPTFRREFSVPLAVTALADRAEILAQVRATDAQTGAIVQAPATCRNHLNTRVISGSASMPARWSRPAQDAAGPLTPAAPSLRPSVLLQLWQLHLLRIAIQVRVMHLPPQRHRPWVARTNADRQARRHTWSQRDQFNALRGRATVVRQPLACDPHAATSARMTA